MSKLLKGSVKAHLFRLTLPGIGGMFAIMVFNLTDTYFVSRLGTEELAAMGFTFSVVMIIGALAIGFSTGSASIITRAIGAGDWTLARRTTSDGLVLTIIGTAVVSVLGYFTITPVFTMLGASGHVLELVREYMQIWFIGAVFAIMPPVTDGCLRSAGDMVRPVIVMCTCAVINCILDPILIFGWGPFPAMGMAGAALATVVARGLGATASLALLHFKLNLINWQVPHIRELLHSWSQIIRLGIPAALTQALNPVAQGFYIRLAAGIGGVQAVAAMATGTRIESIIFIIAMAYSTAITPFVGHNYGAKAYGRVQETRRLSTRFAFLYSGATFLLLLPFAHLISSIFSDNPEVVRMSTIYLLVAALGHAGVHICTWMSQLLNVIGRPRPVVAISLSRVFLFIMPFSLLGSRFFGFTGLVAGLALANLFAGWAAYLATRSQLRKPDAEFAY
ncbi:MATE family efflux transporter [Pontiella sulfatireligans]|uniref:Multidrug-efflux transporter n=1 Tax=Pontiella sulfatireligans TaxID=2750658 RepID=A0A6C2UQS7_9BACT|nr:MATE family efflux transporter [Pontiella sulfatireligans]VGO22650.1 Multidrug export protein MepA [Pontiella sulfatireligans]